MGKARCTNCEQRFETSQNRLAQAWWRDFLSAEKLPTLDKAIRQFNCVKCPNCGTTLHDPSLKILGIFPTRYYWVPYVVILLLIGLMFMYIQTGTDF